MDIINVIHIMSIFFIFSFKIKFILNNIFIMVHLRSEEVPTNSKYIIRTEKVEVI